MQFFHMRLCLSSEGQYRCLDDTAPLVHIPLLINGSSVSIPHISPARAHLRLHALNYQMQGPQWFDYGGPSSVHQHVVSYSETGGDPLDVGALV